MLIRQFPDKETFCKLAGQYNVVPFCIETLADTETPVSLLKKINHSRGPAFLFESVEGGERWGRYSFLGASARSHVRIFSDVIEILENGSTKKISHNGDPFSVLRKFMDQYKPPQLSGLPRFWGGLVGYLTHEAVSFFESIPNKLPKNAPLAHFIMPDEILIFDNIQHTLLSVVIAFLHGKQDTAGVYQEVMDRNTLLLQK